MRCGRFIFGARCGSIAWEWAQLSLGLCIPVLLTFHVVATRIAESVLDVSTYYSTVFIAQWLLFPWLGVVQVLAVMTVWTHACIGIHYWLRTKRWYPNWRPALFSFALLLPTLALAGYVTGGNQILRQAKDPDFAKSSLEDSNLTEQAMAEINRMAYVGWSLWLGLTLLPFAGRGIRDWTIGADGRPCWRMRTAASCRSCPAPRCSRRFAPTASPTRRSAAAGRAAPPAGFW